MTEEKLKINLVQGEEDIGRIRDNFLEKLDYFNGSLDEYENMKGKKYKIIDLGKGITNRIYSNSLLFWRADLRREQNQLVDKLIQENCVGAIRCTLTRRFFVPEQYYIGAYFIKEKDN